MVARTMSVKVAGPGLVGIMRFAVLPNGSRLSCGRLARRRKAAGR